MDGNHRNRSRTFGASDNATYATGASNALMVNEIIQGAMDAEADCIVTACAMCHMNLEIRCSLKERIPVLHFSEIISLALGIGKRHYKGWFSRHLVDPRPLLRALNLF